VLKSAIERGRRLALADPANGLAQRNLARVLFLWAAYERERVEGSNLSTDELETGLLVCLERFTEAAELQAGVAAADRTNDLAQERFACHASTGQALCALARLPERAAAWRIAHWTRAEQEFRRGIEMLEEWQQRGGDSARAGPLIERLERDVELCVSEREALGYED